MTRSFVSLNLKTKVYGGVHISDLTLCSDNIGQVFNRNIYYLVYSFPIKHESCIILWCRTMQEHIRVAHELFNFIYVKYGFSSLFFYYSISISRNKSPQEIPLDSHIFSLHEPKDGSSELFWSKFVRRRRCCRKLFFSRTAGPNFNQTWHKASMGEVDSSLFKWKAPPFSKGR